MVEQQVMTKDQKLKVEVGKRLTEYNHRKREELKVQKSQEEPMLTLSTCYSIGTVLAVGVIGSHGYYLYQAKPRPTTLHLLSNLYLSNPTSLKWSKFLLFYKMDKREYSK